MKILSRWNTSHECDLCDKHYAGKNAALIETDKGQQLIVCAKCVRELTRKKKVKL